MVYSHDVADDRLGHDLQAGIVVPRQLHADDFKTQVLNRRLYDLFDALLQMHAPVSLSTDSETS